VDVLEITDLREFLRLGRFGLPVPPYIWLDDPPRPPSAAADHAAAAVRRSAGFSAELSDADIAAQPVRTGTTVRSDTRAM